jgi:hypothetical protein
MTNVVSISSRKRPGAMPVYHDIHHLGARSFVRLIDPNGWHRIDLSAREARDLEAALKARVGDEPAVIIEFLQKLKAS